MSRYGAMFAPDITFPGVDPCTLDEPETYTGADVVIVGAPFEPYDHADITAFLGNRIVLEALSGMAARRRGAT